MKKIILIVALVSGLFAGNLNSGQEEALQKFVQHFGYRCDSVSYSNRSRWDGSIRLTCNQNRYVYEIKDVGGNWTVRVK